MTEAATETEARTAGTRPRKNPSPLRVILLKPSKYGRDGWVERFRRGFMPNSTLPHLAALTPAQVRGRAVELVSIDEYIETDLNYLRWLGAERGDCTLLALVGVQSHQYQRALDLAAYARHHGIDNIVIGGPHPITCDTRHEENRGVSFAIAEAELIWSRILEDAVAGDGLQSLYGNEGRWQPQLDPVPFVPPPEQSMRRYAVQMLGVYPARGCPYRCSFCSVIQIAGRTIRSQPVETTLATLRAAKAAGILLIMFTTDNFNKYPEAPQLLQAMIDERLHLPFFVQCDVQVARQPDFVALLGRAGCYQMFVGVESFERDALVDVKKCQNHPERYAEIIRLCQEHGIGAHFSNIIGFPGDTAETITEQVEILRRLAPEVASFYVLTPIPGTEQYDDFRGSGLIFERNLDRFDATCSTWRHPHLSASELEHLLGDCYRRFYALPRSVWRSARWYWSHRHSDNVLLRIATGAYSFLSRYAVAQGFHPMAGGVGRVRIDRLDDYQGLRRGIFGCDLIPLPDSRRMPLLRAAG